jgi:hypothetical protein
MYFGVPVFDTSEDTKDIYSINYRMKMLLGVRSFVSSRESSHIGTHKYTWKHTQIDHILIQMRKNVSLLDVRSFRDVTVILITGWQLKRLGRDCQ